MGVITTDKIIDAVNDRRLKRQIKSQYKEYASINKEAKCLLNKNGFRARGISPVQKMTSSMTIRMRTLMNSSPSHIAEMMILGSNMGIVDANKKLHEYKGAERDVRGLMGRLLRSEENNVQRLKDFL